MWPENTMEAFSGAVGLGYQHLETDIHITRDGVPVCIHDDTVDRTTDGSGGVSEFTFAELKELDAGFRHGSHDGYAFRGKGLTVPSLEEVLVSFPDVSFVVDMKIDGCADPLAELLDRFDAHDRLIVGSFSDDRIDLFRDVSAGRVPTSTGTAQSRMWVLASRVGRGVKGEAKALQLPTQIRGVKVVDEKLVQAAHNDGLQVHVWTVNDRAEMERLLDIGVDGVITDRPDVLKELLIERGQWST